jgi:hypothetical protein
MNGISKSRFLIPALVYGGFCMLVALVPVHITLATQDMRVYGWLFVASLTLAFFADLCLIFVVQGTRALRVCAVFLMVPTIWIVAEILRRSRVFWAG